jgi:glycosyltransferase involved in cell wall biosynthesis
VQYASFDIPLFFRLLFIQKPKFVVVEPPPTTGAVTRIVCWIRRIPYYYFSADVTTTATRGIGANRFVVGCVRALEVWALQGAAGVLAVSEGVRREVIELGVAPAKVSVVGTGVDTRKFCQDGPGADVDYPYLVYAGTMSEMQGAGVFIEAFASIADEFPTARLKMFGHGVDLKELKKLADRIGDDRVDFMGVVDSSELSPWLRSARAGLASSRPGTGYHFAFATKGLASLSCGAPVIYAGVGPLRALIENNSLGWASDWDAAQVALSMRAALQEQQDPVRRQELSRWVASNYSLDSVADAAVRVINLGVAQVRRSRFS